MGKISFCSSGAIRVYVKADVRKEIEEWDLNGGEVEKVPLNGRGIRIQAEEVQNDSPPSLFRKVN